MAFLDCVLALVGIAFQCALLVPMLRYAKDRAAKFYWRIKNIRDFLCDATAIGGALLTLLACFDLMAKGLGLL